MNMFEGHYSFSEAQSEGSQVFVELIILIHLFWNLYSFFIPVLHEFPRFQCHILSVDKSFDVYSFLQIGWGT